LVNELPKNRLVKVPCLTHPPGKLANLIGDGFHRIDVFFDLFHGPDGKNFPLVRVTEFALIPGAVSGYPD